LSAVPTFRLNAVDEVTQFSARYGSRRNTRSAAPPAATAHVHPDPARHPHAGRWPLPPAPRPAGPSAPRPGGRLQEALGNRWQASFVGATARTSGTRRMAVGAIRNDHLGHPRRSTGVVDHALGRCTRRLFLKASCWLMMDRISVFMSLLRRDSSYRGCFGRRRRPKHPLI